MSVPVSPVLERFGEIRLAERQQASGLQLPEEDGDPDAAHGDRRHGVEPVQMQDRGLPHVMTRLGRIVVPIGPINQNRSTRRITMTASATPMSVRPFRLRSRESSRTNGSAKCRKIRPRPT